MSIPKVIYQTYKTSKLPLIFKWHIYRLKKKNPEYDYQFYDDERIEKFFKEEVGEKEYNLYKRLNIGAAKADFFRYAILYKRGGVYLDLDSRIVNKIESFVNPNDNAVLSLEGNKVFYIQYALFFEAKHPFLKRTLELIIKNLENNTHPYNTHKMTGPTAFSEAVNQCIDEDSTIPYRVLGVDYTNNVEFSFKSSKTFLYGFSRNKHWKKMSEKIPVIS